ncbi:MAG TPA: hypothetical protein VG871_09795 [Vicinamibacterales bacterium]|nr:hypothetical protein [Vicinamibacterales bacterium]
MVKRLLVCAAAVLVLAGCTRSRDVQKDLKIVDVHTGWYDAGIVDGKNKLVPSISLRLQNVSQEAIANVQMNAVFHRVGEQEAWGEHFVRAVDRSGLDAGATGSPLVLRSQLGYTGTESRAQMLQNSQFVDARVEVFGKHGSNNWQKMGEFRIDRKLLTQ